MPYYHPDPEMPDQPAEEGHNPIVVVIVVTGVAVVCGLPVAIWYVLTYWR